MTLQEFIHEVAGLGLKWSIEEDGKLRTALPTFPLYQMCPIIALARAKRLPGPEGYDLANWEYDLAGPMLGLADETTRAIVIAADDISDDNFNIYDRASVAYLRPMLVQALKPRS